MGAFVGSGSALNKPQSSRPSRQIKTKSNTRKGDTKSQQPTARSRHTLSTVRNRRASNPLAPLFWNPSKTSKTNERRKTTAKPLHLSTSAIALTQSAPVADLVSKSRRENQTSSEETVHERSAARPAAQRSSDPRLPQKLKSTIHSHPHCVAFSSVPSRKACDDSDSPSFPLSTTAATTLAPTPKRSPNHRSPAAHHCTPPALAAGPCLLLVSFLTFRSLVPFCEPCFFSDGQEPNQREGKKDEGWKGNDKRTGSWLQESFKNRLQHEHGPDETGKCRCRALGLLILSFRQFISLRRFAAHNSTFFISSFFQAFYFLSCFAFSAALHLHSPTSSEHSSAPAHTTHTTHIYFVAPTLVSRGLCRVPLAFSFVETKAYFSSSNPFSLSPYPRYHPRLDASHS